MDEEQQRINLIREEVSKYKPLNILYLIYFIKIDFL